MTSLHSFSENQDLPPRSMDGEISLLDILCFLRRAYKTIAIFVAIGLASAIAYIVITPKQFQATAKIYTGQIFVTKSGPGAQASNIEEPSLLIERLSNPISYSQQAADDCNVGGSINPGATFRLPIKLSPLKGVPNAIEMRIFATSPQLAQSCAQAVFEMIKATQQQIAAPFIEGVKIQLVEDEARLKNAKDFIIKADKRGQVIDGAYLSTRDEIRFLLDEIAKLKNILMASQSHATYLIAPIYVDNAPILPSNRIVLTAGILGGLFLGLLMVLARQMVAKLKNDMNNAQ